MEPTIGKRIQPETAATVGQLTACRLPHGRTSRPLRQPSASHRHLVRTTACPRTDTQRPLLTQIRIFSPCGQQPVQSLLATCQFSTLRLHPFVMSHDFMKSFVHHRMCTAVILHFLQHPPKTGQTHRHQSRLFLQGRKQGLTIQPFRSRHGIGSRQQPAGIGNEKGISPKFTLCSFALCRKPSQGGIGTKHIKIQGVASRYSQFIPRHRDSLCHALTACPLRSRPKKQASTQNDSYRRCPRCFAEFAHARQRQASLPLLSLNRKFLFIPLHTFPARKSLIAFLSN